MRKVLCVFLSIEILFSSLFLADITAFAETYYGNYKYNENAITWILDGEIGVLEISGEGEMGEFNSSDNQAEWVSYSQLVTDVKIEKGITTIASNAFSDFVNLKSIEIPDTVISIKNSAFNNCENLLSVTYGGTKEQWQAVVIRDNNESLCTATVNCTDGVAEKTVITPDEKQTTPSTPDAADKDTKNNSANTVTENPVSDNINNSVITQTDVNLLNDSNNIDFSSTTNQEINSSSNKTNEITKPKKSKITKLKKGKKKITVSWKKVSGVKGYQLQLATDKKFKKNKKTVNINKRNKTKTTVKKLKSKKKYYVRVRTYKSVNGKKIYSKWSKIKTIKTK